MTIRVIIISSMGYYIPIFRRWKLLPVHRTHATGADEVAIPSSTAPTVADDTEDVSRFLEDGVVIRIDEDPMTLSEMNAFVRGRIRR